MVIYRFGPEAQRSEWLPSRHVGTMLDGGGLAESGGRADAGDTRTTYRMADGPWGNNAAQLFTMKSMTDISWLVTVTVVTGISGWYRSISTTIVPVCTTDLSVSERGPKAEWPASDPHELSSGTCGVSEVNLLDGQQVSEGVRPVPWGTRKGPHRHRRVVGRAGAGRPAPVPPRCRGARHVRLDHRRLPGGPVQAERHAGVGVYASPPITPQQGAYGASPSKGTWPTLVWRPRCSAVIAS